MKRGRKTETRAARRARQAFTEEVLSRGGCQIAEWIPHCCDGPMDACHVIPKQYLKWHARFDLKLDEAGQLACVWDVRNGIPGCRKGHGLFDSGLHRVGIELIPVETIEFAIEYDCLWKLEAAHPEAA